MPWVPLSYSVKNSLKNVTNKLGQMRKLLKHLKLKASLIPISLIANPFLPLLKLIIIKPIITTLIHLARIASMIVPMSYIMLV